MNGKRVSLGTGRGCVWAVDALLGALAGVLAVAGGSMYLLAGIMTARGQGTGFAFAMAMMCAVPVSGFLGAYVGARFATAIAPNRLSGRSATFAAGAVGGILGLAVCGSILTVQALLFTADGREVIDTVSPMALLVTFPAMLGMSTAQWVVPNGLIAGGVMALASPTVSGWRRLVVWIGVATASVLALLLVDGTATSREEGALLGSALVLVALVSLVGGVFGGLIGMWFEERWR